VGNFHPPVRIVVDPQFVTTLPQRAVVSGLAEAVKICYARGRDAFETYLEFDAAQTPGDDDDTVAFLTHVLTTKKWFVEVDEFDKAERHLLNFGHSFGHAWESACHFSIQHGVGVAAGVLAAIRHPQASRGDLTKRLEQYCEHLLSTVKDDITNALGQTDWDIFLSSLRSDKKNGHDVLRLVLPKPDESVRMVELPLHDGELHVARVALLAVLEDVVS
jgi:3-dehydroquinate synthase